MTRGLSNKGLPDTREMITRLIATPSVSCNLANLDMSNLAVIDLLADWTEGLGFSLETQTVSPGKYNLIATAGSGSDGLVLYGHTHTVPCDDTSYGIATRSNFTKQTIDCTALAVVT